MFACKDIFATPSITLAVARLLKELQLFRGILLRKRPDVFNYTTPFFVCQYFKRLLTFYSQIVNIPGI